MEGTDDTDEKRGIESSSQPHNLSGPLETLTRADVERVLRDGLSSYAPVGTLVRAMAESGCPVGRDFFHVLRCDAAVGGGYAQQHGIILCHNRLHTRQEVLNAMTHELIHAYDDCRLAPVPHGHGTHHTQRSATSAGCGDAPRMGGGPAGEVGCAGFTPTVAQASGAGAAASSHAEGSSSASSNQDPGTGLQGPSCMGGVDWSDCRQHACTEIRAANLSGDCSAWQELMRGNLPLLPHRWAEQQRACVARRAALSVALNPSCGSREEADAAVRAMMDTCLADTAPLGPDHAAAVP